MDLSVNDLLKTQMAETFGYKSFYSLKQEDAMHKVFQGTSNVYINLEPGGGKSLCYQIPTLLKPGTVSLIIVPTHSVAKDQKNFLESNGINVQYLSPGNFKKQLKDIHDQLKNNRLRQQFIYVSVEKSTPKNQLNQPTQSFTDYLKELVISLVEKKVLAYIVYDEAHCASYFSHDWLPGYRKFAKAMKDVCPCVPKIALTGTAVSKVKRDIIHALDLQKCEKIASCSYRPNVYHDVHFLDMIPEPFQHLTDFIDMVLGPKRARGSQENPRRGIIFCRKKETTRIIEKKLSAMNISVVAYHGGLSAKRLESIFEDWTNGLIPVIAMTTNMGIGMTTKDIRFVVHWSMPTSMEQLHQGTGRIKANIKRGFSRLYYSYEEENNIILYIKSTVKSSHDYDIALRKLRNFYVVINYCLGSKCRNVTRWRYFGSSFDKCRYRCDACRDGIELRKKVQDYLKFRTLIHKSIGSNNPTSVPNTAGSHKITQKKREKSCNELFRALEDNMKKTGKVMTEENRIHVTNVAWNLEFCLYIGANLPGKYTHDVAHTIKIIKKCSTAKATCGYLKYYDPEESAILNWADKVDTVDLLDSDQETDFDDCMEVEEIKIEKKSESDNNLICIDLLDSIKEENEQNEEACSSVRNPQAPVISIYDIATDSESDTP